MKSQVKSLLKFLSLSIILSSFVFGLYAQNTDSGILALNSNTSKLKTSPKTNNSQDVKLAVLDLDVVEKTRSLEDWMFNLQIESNNIDQERQFEEWMFDSFFWEIEKNELDEEIVEEEREIEEWMMNFIIKKEAWMCIDIYTDFKEKAWMRKHTFLIL